MALLVELKEKNLLEKSEVLDDYPELKEFLQSANYKKMQYKDLSEPLKEIFKGPNSFFQKIVSIAIEEWSSGGNSLDIIMLENGELQYCELCKRKLTKNVCIITNSRNGKKLEIGTKCVRHFGIVADKDLNKAINEAKRNRRHLELNKEIPNIERISDQWVAFVKQFDIYVKKDIKEKYISLGRKFLQLFEQYCSKDKSDEDDDIISQLKTILMEAEKEKEKIRIFVDSTMNHPFALKKDILRDSVQDIDLLDVLEEDGLITERTLYKVQSKQIARMVQSKVNDKMSQATGIAIKDIVGNSAGLEFVLEPKQNKKLLLACKCNAAN